MEKETAKDTVGETASLTLHHSEPGNAFYEVHGDGRL